MLTISDGFFLFINAYHIFVIKNIEKAFLPKTNKLKALTKGVPIP